MRSRYYTVDRWQTIAEQIEIVAMTVAAGLLTFASACQLLVFRI
jgi:hypothetical protein